MSICTLEEFGVSTDDDGNLDGLQFDGRERSIQEWKEKKEEEEFQELLDRLKERNRSRQRRGADPDGYRDYMRKYRERNRIRIRENARRRERERREENPIVNQCKECGTVWTPPLHEQKRKRANYCSQQCRYHAYSKAKKKAKQDARLANPRTLTCEFCKQEWQTTSARTSRYCSIKCRHRAYTGFKGVKDTTLKPRVLAQLKQRDWSKAATIAEALGIKTIRVRGCLANCLKAGDVVARPFDGNTYEYALSDHRDKDAA